MAINYGPNEMLYANGVQTATALSSFPFEGRFKFREMGGRRVLVSENCARLQGIWGIVRRDNLQIIRLGIGFYGCGVRWLCPEGVRFSGTIESLMRYYYGVIS